MDEDLTHRLGPIEPVLARIDPLLATPRSLTQNEFKDLLAFVGEGLLDERARRGNLCMLVPKSVPSGMSLLHFEGCPQRRN